jgi:hypothetical protein
MPKILTPAMRAHLDAETTRVAAIWRITRKDGQQFFFTDHDRDIVFGGEVYRGVSQVQLRPRVRREVARTETSVTCLGWLRRHCQCRHDSCEQHVFAHRGRSLIARAA